MSTSTTTQIRGRVAYIFQRNPVVDITPITPDDDTMWAAASMTPEQIQLSGTTHPVWVWANLPDATRKRYPRRISYEALQNFSTAIAASAWSSMIGNQHVYAIDLHVTDYEALTTLLSFIERTIGEGNGHIGSVGIQFKTPFYRYYRETQVAKNNVSSCMFRQYRDCAAAIRRPRKDLQPSSKKPGMALFWKELIIILTEPLNHCPANIRALVVEAEDIGIQRACRSSDISEDCRHGRWVWKPEHGPSDITHVTTSMSCGCELCSTERKVSQPYRGFGLLIRFRS